jgi:hypothetical protein
MKTKNYRILLSIWVLLILFFLGQFLYTSLFQTIYPSLLDKLYAITSFMWKYFLTILFWCSFMIPTSELNKKIELRTQVFVISVLLILSFFLIRHVVLVSADSNYNLVVWNFVYGHIVVSIISAFLSVLILKFNYSKNMKLNKTDEI